LASLAQKRRKVHGDGGSKYQKTVSTNNLDWVHEVNGEEGLIEQDKKTNFGRVMEETMISLRAATWTFIIGVAALTFRQRLLEK
jgi:hypothetical protein